MGRILWASKVPGAKIGAQQALGFRDCSDRHNREESIAENGTHYGIEVFGKVFDNLSSEGISREEWLNDSHCASEQFIVDELESLGE